MDTVRVSKADLLKKLKENRAKHAQTYKDAVEVYTEEAIKQLEEFIKEFKAGDINHTYLTVTRPVEHLSEYDQVIEMLEWSADEYVNINHMNFRQYVLDQWSWTLNYTESTVMLANNKKFKA